MASTRDKTPRLVIIEGKDKGKVIPLKKGTAIIGRFKADILLNDTRVSRAHVALNFNEDTGELSYTDLKSLNGILINGELRETGTLKDGDRLLVGNTLFDCQLMIDGETEVGTLAKNGLEPRSANSISLPGPSRFAIESIPPEQLSPPHIAKIIEKSSPGPNTTLSSKNLNSSSVKLNRKHFFTKIPKSIRVGAISLVLLFLLISLLPDPATRSLSNKTLENYSSEINKLMNSRNFDEAKKIGIECVKSYPTHSVPLILLGDVYFELRKFDLAIDSYQRSLTLKPIQLVAFTRLIRLHMISNHIQEAKTLLAQFLPLLNSGMQNSKIHVQAGELFLDYPELEPDPKAQLQRALSLQSKEAPNNSIGYKLESQLISMTEKNTESIKRSEEILKKGLVISPRDEWILDRLFYLKLTQKEPKQATAILETWIKLNSKSTKPLLLISYLKFNEKNFLSAIPFLQRILSLLIKEPSHPHYSEALNLMGQISMQQNQLAEAENFLIQSCKLGYQPSCSHPLLVGIPSPSNGPTPASVPSSSPSE